MPGRSHAVLTGAYTRINALAERVDALEESGGGGGAVTPFRPENYGAVRDGSTDDTAALKACVADAVATAVADGSYYAEVQLSSGIYQLNGALTQGGATAGNALIPLPVIPDTNRKFILVFKGTAEQATLWHWNQTTTQTAGAILRTNVAGTNHATFGPASVIGGPTPQQGYGSTAALYSNMLVVVDGVQVVVPNNPAICGFDFAGVAQMTFRNGSVITTATPATRSAPTNDWQFGLRTPQNNNNAKSRIGEYACESLNYGCILNEHTNADEIHAIYCVAGIEFGDTGTSHGIIVRRACIEASDVALGVLGTYPVKVRVDQLDFENISFGVVNDPSARLLGTVYASGIGDTTPLVDQPSGGSNGIRGAANLKVYDTSKQKGTQASSPAVPATTVALRNPFWRDAFVHITGGTVTAVQITDSGGSAQTVATSTGVPVLLPTGAYITLTYSAAPTWKWTLL